MIMHKIKMLACAALGLSCLTGPALAQARSDAAFQITPYVWAMGVGGDITPFTGAPTVAVDASFADLLEDLDAAFFVSAYARQGDLVFLGDFSTSSSSRSGVTPSPPAPAALPATGTLRQTSITALVGSRVMTTPDATVDLLAGFRHWNVKGGVAVPLIPAAATRSRSFTDPVIAARANFQIAPDWSALAYADVGGFGVGSERTAQLLGTVNYRWRDNTFVSVGYRALQMDYRDGGTRFDVRMGGPVLGVTFRF
ncbi:hypothetical protein [Yoonia sp.]|uniref:hypothetical protein n=1 Tax=Yoonia sp. TaxID=2212373 RepID=UPI0019E94C37|nr:hypothetical protein [Yoonia sp.]MBE0414687.1 hypothetical protein [Yoonia sp.]